MKKKIMIALSSIFIILFLFLFFFQPIESIYDITKGKEFSIKDENNQEILHLINQHKTTPINIEKMNKKNIDILLTIEDKSFYQHSGFNIGRIFKTIFSNLKNNKSEGASTITQQYIKNVYLSNNKTLSRKIKELYYAIKLEQAVPKNQILEGYLNCIYLGNDIYGIADASHYYFNKSYEDLSIKEMTTFVALLNAPTYYSENIEKLNERKNILLKSLLKQNVITNEEYETTITPIQFHYNKNIYNSNLLFYVDQVLKEYEKINIPNKFNQVIEIETAYRPSMNEIKFNTDGDYASISVNKEGYILSLIGGKDYTSSKFNIATKGKRDIGSTIKPLLYYEALKCGFSTNKSYYSSPYSFTYQNEKVTIKNNNSNYPNRNITMKEALAASDNIYAIKMHQELGFKTLANHLKKYKIDTDPLPSLALGSIGMSLYDLTRIYTQFFTEGKYYSLSTIRTVKVRNKVLYTKQPKYKILGESKYFKQIKDLMQYTFDSTIPNATAANLSPYLKNKCYGKSGSTLYDSYMIGFNEKVLVSAWSGYIDNKELNEIEIKQLARKLFVNQINFG
ncbi:MAG: penicillin-binding protein [Anaeroplasmataceae bacterium]|nr:penicillin-binding protein [Anaeroplasmataceae bacterium]